VQETVAHESILAAPLAMLPAYRGRALIVSAVNDAQLPGSDSDPIFAAWERHQGQDASDDRRNQSCQAKSKFKLRYATLGFQPVARLDDEEMWPVAFALTSLTTAGEKQIAELVKKAAG
jgi:hypothetical protein